MPSPRRTAGPRRVEILTARPGRHRTRLTPALGAEILWNAGPRAAAAPVNAPAVFVVAANRYVRGPPARQGPIGGDRCNNVSIGLIIRFNNFFFYTGGDLPSEGEDLALDDILSTRNGNGLPDPQDPAARFPAPNHICAFKCGHHGSATSTSDNVVNRVAAGLDFTAFEMIDASAPVAVAFGVDVELALLGIARVTVPKLAPEPIVSLEITLAARFKPSMGLLALDGRLTPASFIYAGLTRSPAASPATCGSTGRMRATSSSRSAATIHTSGSPPPARRCRGCC